MCGGGGGYVSVFVGGDVCECVCVGGGDMCVGCESVWECEQVSVGMCVWGG